jgi:hypothetical protein
MSFRLLPATSLAGSGRPALLEHGSELAVAMRAARRRWWKLILSSSHVVGATSDKFRPMGYVR